MSAVASNEASLMAEIGDAIRHQLHALADRPDPDTATNIAVNLDGARRAVLRLREAMMKRTRCRRVKQKARRGRRRAWRMQALGTATCR